MIKFDQFELYNSIFKALKKTYLGDLYLVIESITFNFDEDEPNDLFSLNYWGYEVKGRYGREENPNKKDAMPLHENFTIYLDEKDTAEMIQAKFEQMMMSKDGLN